MNNLYGGCWLPRFVFVSLLIYLRYFPTQASEAYFYHHIGVDELGDVNYEATSGNPLRGLIANPDFWHDPTVRNIDSAMDIWYIGLDSVMRNNPDWVGPEAAFNWTIVEDRLARSGANGRHAVFTFNVHYPGEPLRLPPHIRSMNLPLRYYSDVGGGGLSPYYGDPYILNAMEQFIAEFGRQYNGDPRIAFIHLGLLGFW